MSDQMSVFGRRDRVMAQQVDGQSVLLNIDSGEYFSLNRVGGRVWELVDGERSVGSIVQAVCDEYEADPTSVLEDTTELLSSLAEAGLVVER